VKARGYALPGDATADEAFRLTLTHCRWHILANVPAVLDACEAEGVHQLRVALRRLRVALAAFGKEFRGPAIEALRIRAKILAQGLAPARDMDVFLDELFEPAAQANGAPDAFAILRDRAHAARQEAWERAHRETSGLTFHTFLHDLADCIDRQQWREGAPGAALAIFDEPVCGLASDVLAKRLKEAKRQARGLETLTEPERHQLRIALKKLRYTTDFFASLYPARQVKPFQKRLGQMQDILGSLQDVAVARSTLKNLTEEPEGALYGVRADLSFAAGTIYGWHLDRANLAWRDAMSRWTSFAKAKPFWTKS
jgi:CHAD domain-containing protein